MSTDSCGVFHSSFYTGVRFKRYVDAITVLFHRFAGKRVSILKALDTLIIASPACSEPPFCVGVSVAVTSGLIPRVLLNDINRFLRERSPSSLIKQILTWNMFST